MQAWAMPDMVISRAGKAGGEARARLQDSRGPFGF